MNQNASNQVQKVIYNHIAVSYNKYRDHRSVIEYLHNSLWQKSDKICS